MCCRFGEGGGRRGPGWHPAPPAHPRLSVRLAAGLVALPLWGLANWFRMAAVPGGAWAWALGLHLASWFAQIVLGHQMCEHRKPALMDSFFQVGAGAGRRVRGRGRGALQQPRSDVLLASLPTRPHNDVPPPTHTHTSSFKPLDADPAPPCPAEPRAGATFCVV